MNLLVGATGYVGSTILKTRSIENLANSRNMKEFTNAYYESLYCAGLPAQKWIANSDPAVDFNNMTELASNLQSIKAEFAYLISTVDAYQDNSNKTESNPPDLTGPSAYGVNRAWFELFFAQNFRDHLILRLPGLFSKSLRKNLIFDLVNNREEQIMKVHPESTFQFFNLDHLEEIMRIGRDSGLRTLNVATEPVRAQEVASIYGHTLKKSGNSIVKYNFKSDKAELFGGKNGYLFDSSSVLSGIAELKVNFENQ